MLSVVHFLRSFFKVRGGFRGPAMGAGQRLAAHGESRRAPLRPGPTAGHRVGGGNWPPPAFRRADRETESVAAPTSGRERCGIGGSRRPASARATDRPVPSLPGT